MALKLHSLFSQSISRMVLVSFVLVLALPIAFFVSSLSENSWENVQQDMLNKHLMIATALVEPLNLFIAAKHESLKALSRPLISANLNIHDNIQEHLDKYINEFSDVIALSYFSFHRDLQITSVKRRYRDNYKIPDYVDKKYKRLEFKNDYGSGVSYVTPIFKSEFSGQSVFILKHLIIDHNKNHRGVLHIEISLDFIRDMCSSINFGEKGHCAIVDGTGQIIAHPNKVWEGQRRNLSKISVIQKMLKGGKGTMEFYSPFIKADMVVGYASVDLTGWGVMIPQPKREVTEPFNEATVKHTIWLLLGASLALILAFFLSRIITGPIKHLVSKTYEFKAHQNFADYHFGEKPRNSPGEISELWQAISSLITDLQKSNNEINTLNNSLQADIKKATAELEEKNAYLSQVSNQDYLTGLANRRYFEAQLKKELYRKADRNAGLILIDVDKFKSINDIYGHDIGDLALKHVSSLLLSGVRQRDIVARLGGDEFVIYIHDSSEEILRKIAESLQESLREQPLVLDDSNKQLAMTLSIGIVNHKIDGNVTLSELLHYADEAMYLSKGAGRDQVSIYTCQSNILSSVDQVNNG